MLRQFLKDSAIYGLTGLLSRGISLLLVPLYTRVLAPRDFGVIDLITIFAALVKLTVTLEISQGLARSYVETRSRHEQREYVSTAFWFSVAIYAAFVAIGLLASGPLSRTLLESATWEGVFRVAVVAIAANGLFYLLQSQLRWQLQPRAFGATSIIYILVTGLVAVALVIGFGQGVVGIFYGQLCGSLAGCIAAWWLSRDSYALRFDLEKFRKMLEFSIPLVPSSVAVFLAIYVDRICIREFMTLTDLGIYGVAFRFASVIGLLMIGFQSALTPLVYQHQTEASTPRHLARIFQVFLMLAILGISGIFLFSGDVLRVFTTPDYYPAASVLPLLAIASLLATMYVFAPGLAIAKRTRSIAIINVIAAIVNLALNLLLIPRLGLRGSALATAFGAGCAFTMHMWLSQRTYPVPHVWTRLGAGVAIAMVAVGWGGGLASRLPAGEPAVLAKLAVLAITAPLVAWAVLGSDEFRKLMRYGIVRLQLIDQRQ